MLKRINFYWRVVATGISFVIFGVGGILSRFIVFPILNALVRDSHVRSMHARNIIRFLFRAFIELMRFLGVLCYDIRGLERLDRKGLLIIANHPTLIDTVFLMAFIKQADCIVKSTLWQNPFTLGPVRAANYIVNTNGPSLVEACIASLQSGSNLIIFPEGTRTLRDDTLKFKRGAANIAIRGKYNITPVVIRCTPPTLRKGEKWWKVPAQIPLFIIEVQEDIEVQTLLANADNEILKARHLTNYLQDYFINKEKIHAAT